MRRHWKILPSQTQGPSKRQLSSRSSLSPGLGDGPTRTGSVPLPVSAPSRDTGRPVEARPAGASSRCGAPSVRFRRPAPGCTLRSVPPWVQYRWQLCGGKCTASRVSGAVERESFGHNYRGTSSCVSPTHGDTCLAEEAGLLDVVVVEVAELGVDGATAWAAAAAARAAVAGKGVPVHFGSARLVARRPSARLVAAGRPRPA